MAKVLYVARRAFKCRGVLYEAGQIIENPTSITLLRSRILDRDILELTEGSRQNGAWLAYLKAKVKKPLDKRILEICGEVVKEAPTPAPTPAPVAQPAATPATKPVKPATTQKVVKPVSKK